MLPDCTTKPVLFFRIFSALQGRSFVPEVGGARVAKAMLFFVTVTSGVNFKDSGAFGSSYPSGV